MKIEDLELTVRSNKCLKQAGINSVEQLLNIEWDVLCNMRNAGDKTISQIVWTILMLYQGKLLERTKEWHEELNFPEGDWHTIRKKARKYDKIAEIMKTDAD